MAVALGDDGTNSWPARDGARVLGGAVDDDVGALEAAPDGGGQLSGAQLHAVRVSQAALVHSAHARPDRVRLVVLFGGQSAEHEVSCVSAFHVLRAVDQDRYDLEAVGITREGDWVRADDAIAALHRGAGELPAAHERHRRLEATGTAVEPLPAVTPAIGDDVPVVVLPLLHGPRGEDGTVQGMLELAGVPSSAPACSARRCAWTSSRPRTSSPPTASPRCPWIGAARHRARRRRRAASTTPASATRCS